MSVQEAEPESRELLLQLAHNVTRVTLDNNFERKWMEIESTSK